MRQLTDGIDGVLGRGRVLIVDRDRKWSRAAVEFLEGKLLPRFWPVVRVSGER